MKLIETLENRQLMSVSLDGATGVLTVNGTAGHDVISAKTVGSNLVVTDNGVTKSFAASKVKSLKVLAKAGADKVTISSNVYKPAYIDTGTGAGVLGDSVQSGSGNDTIIVGSAHSTVLAGNGNDIIVNKVGLSSLFGQAGNDAFRVQTVGEVTETKYDGGTGVDTIRYAEADTGTPAGPGTKGILVKGGQVGYYALAGATPAFVGGGKDTIPGVENINGTNRNDYIYTGNVKATVRALGGHDFVQAGALADKIFGGTGNDALHGGDGNDYIEGNAGNDFLSGSYGADALYGNDGNDTFYSKDGTKDFLSGGFGTDKANRDAIDVINSVEGNL